MLGLLDILAITVPCYFVADAYYEAGKIVSGLRLALSLRDCSSISPSLLPSSLRNSFGSWLRTIRPGIPPSEFVVANALHQTLPEFLMSYSEANSLAKFIADRQDNGNMRIFRLAS